MPDVLVKLAQKGGRPPLRVALRHRPRRHPDRPIESEYPYSANGPGRRPTGTRAISSRSPLMGYLAGADLAHQARHQRPRHPVSQPGGHRQDARHARRAVRRPHHPGRGRRLDRGGVPGARTRPPYAERGRVTDEYIRLMREMLDARAGGLRRASYYTIGRDEHACRSPARRAASRSGRAGHTEPRSAARASWPTAGIPSATARPPCCIRPEYAREGGASSTDWAAQGGPRTRGHHAVASASRSICVSARAKPAGRRSRRRSAAPPPR